MLGVILSVFFETNYFDKRKPRNRCGYGVLVGPPGLEPGTNGL